MKNILQNDCITNLFELENITNSINNLEYRIKLLSQDSSLENFERKIKINELNKEKKFLKNILSQGIKISEPLIVKEIKNDIIHFFKENGLEEQLFLEKLNNITFYITNEKLSSGGILSTYSKKIFIDYTLAEFDEQGNFLNFKADKIDFIKYTLIHEFLHICSTNPKISFLDDAFSEGYTDLFAQVIFKNTKYKSEKYDYFVRLCTLFTNLVGIKSTINDYFYNLETLPNLKKIFKNFEIGEHQFLLFHQTLNKIMMLQIESKNNDELANLKKNIIYKIKEDIFIPYLKNYIGDKQDYVNLFNDLFKDFEINISLDEVKYNVK